MDQFSHDLTVALEETSLLDRARVSRWGQRRRTRSTGNLPCAPQPTEDSSSSPTDTVQVVQANANVDGLDTNNVPLVPSDSDEALRMPYKALNSATRLGALESDSLNEAFSPARFFKPSARRKRKLKRMAVDYELGATAQGDCIEAAALNNNPGNSNSNSIATGTGTVRKRVLKPDLGNRSNLFFCGKRKRSNRDRYHEHDPKAHSSSMPRHNYLEEHRMRPRSFSSTSKPHSERLLPLNKGLLSKIERISQLQKTDVAEVSSVTVGVGIGMGMGIGVAEGLGVDPVSEDTQESVTSSTVKQAHESSPTEVAIPKLQLPYQQQQQRQPQQPESEESFHGRHRKKANRVRRRTQLQQLQFAVQHPMDCGELNDFLSSSSLSSSESDDAHTANDTDREGDDELTDWPGNEGGSGPVESKYDSKRKLTKRSNLPQIKSDDGMLAEDDTLMSGSGEWSPIDLHDPLEMRYQPSEPIAITTRGFGLGCGLSGSNTNHNMSIPLNQIESEMSGETSNPFLASPPCQPTEVREIRAGCRRIKGERPGFSIKTSVNERLARFLQDARQMQIRLPDIEIYEHESLINLATLYSLQMSLDNGCAVLTKTSNTTQSVAIDQQSLQSRLFLGDFKRRCYDNKSSFVPQK